MSSLQEKLEQAPSRPGKAQARLDQIFHMWGYPVASKHRSDGMVLEVQRKTMSGIVETWRRISQTKDSLFEKVEG